MDDVVCLPAVLVSSSCQQTDTTADIKVLVLRESRVISDRLNTRTIADLPYTATTALFENTLYQWSRKSMKYSIFGLQIQPVTTNVAPADWPRCISGRTFPRVLPVRNRFDLIVCETDNADDDDDKRN